MKAFRLRLFVAIIITTLNALPAAEPDRDRLQGKWQIQSVALAESVFKREDCPEGWKATFAEDVTIEGDRLSHSQAAKGAWKVEETRSPKQITFRDADDKLTFRGIYKLENDTLTICVNGDGTDVRRPEEFVTKAGTSLIVIALKKRK